MHRIISFTTALIFMANFTITNAQELIPGKQSSTKLDIELTTDDGSEKATIQYWISLPENYNDSENCPLIVFLHGRGESGDDINMVKKHGPPKLLAEKNDTPFIVVSPQNPEREWWRVDKLTKLLDHIMKTTKADPDRVYLTGLSMGGFGTWAWLAQEPDRFAAAIPICGGGNPNNAAKLSKIPIWVFHGADDRVVPLNRSEAMVDAIKKVDDANVKLTVYPKTGHDSWTETYNNKEIYDWFLKHKRRK